MDEATGIRREGAISSDGLTVLCDPPNSLFDVVFVHGFTGHPERTWVHQKGDPVHQKDVQDGSSVEPPAKSRRINRLGRSVPRDSVHSAVYWPRDLLPQTIPNARILTYGYDTRLRHAFSPSGSASTVYDISQDFLVALESKRRFDSRRQIFFIVHSLGGIIVKEMLRQSNLCQAGRSHLRNTFSATSGIIFFGTPHGGADPRNLFHHIVETIIKGCGIRVNDQIVKSLLPNSEGLRQLRDEFGPMAIAEKWLIHSFQEGLGVAALNGRKAVEDVSSLLGLPSIEISEHIGRNHMDMCRFTGLHDVEYGKVTAALLRMTAMVHKPSVGSQVCSLTDSQKQALMNSLKFDQIDARQMTIKRAHAKTCEWLLRKPEYLDWVDITKLNEHHGFLWIKGKPGAGKSTMMKFVLGHCKKKMSDKIIISFFFNARGETLEKSTIGMYRALCLALLEKVPILRDAFEFLGIEGWNCSDNHQWSVDSVEELFSRAIQMLPQSTSIMCLIDALDECDEDSVRNMVFCFERLGEEAISAGLKFQICFSSRNYPTITIDNGLSLVLEKQEEHTQDITSYVSSNLKIKKGKLAKKIVLELKEKAMGVFMWVVLVVDLLNKDYDKGLVHTLLARLREIPSDLNELFRDIVTRDTSNKKELLLSIQWLLFSRTPLTPAEFYFAVIHGIQSGDELLPWDPEEIDMETFETFVSNASKGLAEVTKSKKPTVQFIHESVRDFLRTKEGRNAISPSLGTNFEGESHDRLKAGCLQYLSIDFSAQWNNSSPLPKASSMEITDLQNSISGLFPFFKYSVQNVLHYSNSAQKSSVDQKAFVQSFPLTKWIGLDNIFLKHDTRRHSSTASLLYILAEANLSNLIRVHSTPQAYFVAEESQQEYRLPILAAMACDSRQAVLAFLEIEENRQPQVSLLHNLCNEYRGEINSQPSLLPRSTYLKGKLGPIFYFAKYGQNIVLRFLVAAGHISEKAFSLRDKKYTSPLEYAVQSGQSEIIDIFRSITEGEIEWNSNIGQLLHAAVKEDHVKIVRMLLEKASHHSANAKDDKGYTPLQRAAASGKIAIVQQLLSSSHVDIDSPNKKGETALMLASSHGRKDIVQILLNTCQVDVEARDIDGGTPLSRACSRYLDLIVQQLLKTGQVDINSKDNSGRTPFSWAASTGGCVIIRLLLSTGQVDVDSKDNEGRTPLSWAASHSSESTLQLLVSTGQVDIDSRDNSGRTPLSWAASHSSESTLQLLVSTGQVDVDSRDNSGRTPLSWAASHRSVSTLQSDSRDYSGPTPLSWAASSSYYATRVLLETGSVVVDSGDSSGRTPLFWAVNHRYREVVQLLLTTKQVDVHREDAAGQTPMKLSSLSNDPNMQRIHQMLLVYDKAGRNTST